MEKYIFTKNDNMWSIWCLSQDESVADNICNSSITSIFGKQAKSFLLNVSDDKFTGSIPVVFAKGEAGPETFEPVQVREWYTSSYGDYNYNTKTYYEKSQEKAKHSIRVNNKSVKTDYLEEMVEIFTYLWDSPDEGDKFEFYWKVSEIK